MASIERRELTAEQAAGANPSWNVKAGDPVFIVWGADDEAVGVYVDANEAQAALMVAEGIRFA